MSSLTFQKNFQSDNKTFPIPATLRGKLAPLHTTMAEKSSTVQSINDQKSTASIQRIPIAKAVSSFSDNKSVSVTNPIEGKIYDLTWDNSNDLDSQEVFPAIEGKAQIYPIETSAFAQIRPIQKWEGTVVEVKGKRFWGKLRDLTIIAAEPAEEASFDFSEVNSIDWPLIQVGAVFYWVISLKTELSTGQPITENTVYFRRQLKATKQKLTKIQKEAEALYALIQKNNK